MSATSHAHSDDIIVDADEHFIIDTVTRAISSESNKKLSLMQYDAKSERYSFDIDRFIDGHDLFDCNRVQIHFINTGSNRQKHPGLYLVDDVKINPDDENKITFTWLVSQDATFYSGALSFLISFECVEGDTILYRWSSNIFSSIEIKAGMDNDNSVVELYADELLAWEHYMATALEDWQSSMELDFIPRAVDERYIDREFASSEEVAAIFALPEEESGSVVITSYEPVTDDEINNLFIDGSEGGVE